ncbi:tubby C-terminal domain-like protein [Robertmurraya sp. GLU-23]
MEKFSYTIPMVKGVKKPVEILNADGVSVANIQRYYPNLINILTEIFITGWEVNLQVTQDGSQLTIKDKFRWVGNEWLILEDNQPIGSIKDIKKFEWGDTKELLFRGKKYYYLDKPLETRKVIQSEDNKVIASINYKLFDMSRKKEIEVFNNDVPISLIVCISYLSTLKNRA